MKKTLKNIAKVALLTSMFTVIAGLAMPAVPTFAAPTISNSNDNSCGSDLSIANGANCSKGDKTPNNLFDGDDGVFKNVVNIMLFLIGSISVIMLIVGGIRYTVSQGESSAVTSAKNTIMYAVVGIVVSILAYAIVNFVIGSFTADS